MPAIWSKLDEQVLYDFWGLVPDKTLARCLNRTVRALHARAVLLGISKLENLERVSAAQTLNTVPCIPPSRRSNK